MKKYLSLLLLIFVAFRANAQFTIREKNAIPLHGEWSFALDPANMGVVGKWYSDKVAEAARFDKVTVPHCFSSDKRFEFYTGTAWYRKAFHWQKTKGNRIILHFDAAYYKTRIWLNNQEVGTHEGGYTPFHFDITDLLTDGDNNLAVSVNNDTWQPGSVPGSKDDNAVNNPFMGWVNYGGLIRPIYLTIEPEVYAENLKIEATPDLEKGTATLKAKIRVRNTTGAAASLKTSLFVTSEEKPVQVSWKIKNTAVPAGTTGLIEAEASLTAAQVKLWELDRPHLYHLTAITGSDTISSRFGIRKVEIKNVQLLLNGKSLKLAGGNRVVDYPGLGSLEPDWLIEKDFRLMKEAGMEFHRLTHYTPSERFYELADEYGMLIITEAGNWQLTPKQMDKDSIRANFRHQFTEMAERDWNHPSVIAYSVGNEYASDHPSGQRWTKDMIEFAKSVDPTRLYTFASMQLNRLPKTAQDEASQYVDFVCTNTYGGHARSLDHIHSLYPDKPILISEWGVRADNVPNGKGSHGGSPYEFPAGEVNQAKHITDVLAEIRKRPYVIGASWWTYNDYQSRYHGTNANGYRPWGIVRPDRSERPAYYTHQEEMAVVTIEKVRFDAGAQGNHQLTIRITARKDFPAYSIRDYDVETAGGKVRIPALAPGEQAEVKIPVTGFDKELKVKIFKPTGFKVTEKTFELK